MKIPIFYAFARSGGTLLNRCLGSIPGNLVLSEVNPHRAVLAIEQQAQEWLQLISAEQVPEFAAKTYVEKITDLAQFAQHQSQHLILRDWVSVNFLKLPPVGQVPSYVLEQSVYLEQAGFTLLPLVLSRRAADVYDSIGRTFNSMETLSVEAFGSQYLRYAQAVAHQPIVHYETFCEAPEATLQQICQQLEIAYDRSFLENFSHFTHCTGDNMQAVPSRGLQLNRIQPLRSSIDSPAYQAACQNPDCQQADALLQYV